MPAEQTGGIPLKEYVDAKIAELQTAIGLIEVSTRSVGVPLREHINELFDERDRAKDLAEREREKAAQALREELTRQIEQGDEALREHISQQVAQIREALLSAEKLEVARIDAVQKQLAAQLEAQRREQQLQHDSSERAIAKAETANEKRFESVNEFRDSLTDQTASFLPREVAEAQFAEIRRSVQELADKINKLV